MPENGLFALDASPSLRSRISDALRDAIAEGRLKPGQRLIERELCEVFKVSRPSLREAMRELEAEGYIETVPHRGPRVCTVDENALRNGSEALAVLESLSARLCAERADDKQRQVLRERLIDLHGAVASAEKTIILKTRDAFFDSMLDAANNKVVAGMLRPLRHRLTQTRGAALDHPGRAVMLAREANEILSAIERKDGEGAQRLCTASLTAGYIAALHVIRSTVCLQMSA